MDAERINQLAHALYRAHGDKAEAEAAAKARDAGPTEEAEDWQAVRSAIRAIRGANQS